MAKILDTTLAEVARVGYENLSIEEVALRAGVNKTTVYRRWPTVDVLVVDAFGTIADKYKIAPDTGSLRDDLVAFLKVFRDLCLSPTLLSLMRMHFSGGFRGKLKTVVDRLSAEGDCDALTMFEHAVGRGELPKGTDIALVRDLLLGSVQNLVLFRHQMPTDETIDRVVDIILLGAANGAGVIGAPRASERIVAKRRKK